MACYTEIGNMTTQTAKNKNSGETLQAILEELRLLRNEVMLLLPQKDLEDYAHPERIKSSYQKALKKYPPAASPLWK